jgi:hypothetical protein
MRKKRKIFVVSSRKYAPISPDMVNSGKKPKVKIAKNHLAPGF